jgi:hypothetical protein
LARLRSPLPALFAALALGIQLLALPFHHPIAAPGSAEAAAQQLRGLFGDGVVICAQVVDSSGPTVPKQAHCGDECPLCQLAGQVANLIVPPIGAALNPPARTAIPLVARPESVDQKARLNPLAQARAPPLAV